MWRVDIAGCGNIPMLLVKSLLLINCVHRIEDIGDTDKLIRVYKNLVYSSN